MKRKLFIVLTIFSTIILASCKTKANKEFKPSLDKNTNCEITVAGSYKNFESLEEEFDKFNKYYPNVELSYAYYDDYNNIIGKSLDGNSAPNIFFSYTWMFGNPIYDSVVSHMEDLSDSKLKIDLDCIRDGLINKTNGKVLMLPVFSRTYGMLINENIFKKEKIDVPKTWNELEDICGKLKDDYVSPMMGYSNGASSSFMNTIAYPLFVVELAKNPTAIELANNLDQGAGQYMKTALEKVEYIVDNGYVNIQECDKIADNYEQVLLRFFKGDVPMMICTADTVSGTKKRESMSENFSKSPFNYSFAPIPLTDEGGYFIDSPSLEFSVNKDCDNLDMTNEFMRFLISSKELSEMASLKRLVTPTKEMPFHSIYDSLKNVPNERIFFPEALGITDPISVQTRNAAFKVGRKELTVDEAIENYGKF